MNDLPADVALQVLHVGKWRLFCASYRGLQHVEHGVPRQDAFALVRRDSVINIAVADGLGSADSSHLGAQRACDRGVEVLSLLRPRAKGDFYRAFKEIQQDFFRNAVNYKTAAREFATTLQLLRIDDEGFWYGRMGDGGCVLLDIEGAKWLGGLDRSPLGVTNLSDKRALSRLECDSVSAQDVVGFLIFSDGLEDIFLEPGKRGPDEENIRRMINLVKAQKLEQLVELYNRFLSSDLGKDLKDDKTIIAGALDTSVLAPPLEHRKVVPPVPPMPPKHEEPPSWLTKRKALAIGIVFIAGLLWAIRPFGLFDYASKNCFWFDLGCQQPNPAPAQSMQPDPQSTAAQVKQGPPPTPPQAKQSPPPTVPQIKQQDPPPTAPQVNTQTAVGEPKDTAALAAAAQSVDSARKLAAQDPSNVQAQRDLSARLDNFGDAKLQAGDHSGALAAYQESLANRRQLAAQHSGDAQARTDLVLSLYKISVADPMQARIVLNEALRIVNKLDEEQKLIAGQRELFDRVRGALSTAR
jgi:hypothetical protein